MFHISTDHGVVGGPLLHALSIPARNDGPCMTSPADTIASSLISPADTYAPSALSSASSHCGPFTPADALQMVALAAAGAPRGAEDVPENVDAEHDASEMPFGFWPGAETLWANMDGLMPDDFNLGSIPPVELGLAQFEALPGGGAPVQLQCDEGPAGGLCPEWMPRFGIDGGAHDFGEPPELELGAAAVREEHDYDDAAAAATAPGGPAPSFSVYAHEPMTW